MLSADLNEQNRPIVIAPALDNTTPMTTTYEYLGTNLFVTRTCKRSGQLKRIFKFKTENIIHQYKVLYFLCT